METKKLILQGQATDRIWAMRSQSGTIGLCLDDGEAGTVSLTPVDASVGNTVPSLVISARWRVDFDSAALLDAVGKEPDRCKLPARRQIAAL